VDRLKPKCAVHIYIHEDLCTVSLDSSGQSLHKRGYRTAKVHAPLQESLAFAILSYTRWNRTECICDLMCGSGTLAIEAALMACGRAPGLNRSYFSFKYWPGFNKKLWKELTEQARISVRKTHIPPVFAYDVSARAVEAARINSRVAGVDKIITFKKQNIRDFRHPMPGKGGILLCNPPYGVRQGAPEGTSALYSVIGDVLKREGQGCTGYIFTGNPVLSKKVGLRTKRRIMLYNGELECRLLEYELYSGTRKVRKKEYPT
jgi:putative N6-adenine-specific DNA methylase